jgi:acyl carrier protein
VSADATLVPSSDDVLALLRKTMHAEFGLDPDAIEPSQQLIEDLDLDSIDLVDLAVALEEQSGIVLEEEELKSVRTVADAVRVVHAAFARRGSGGR